MAVRAYVTGVGALSSVGSDAEAVIDAVVGGRSGLARLPEGVPGAGLVAGRIEANLDHPRLPRTHQLALRAAREACDGRVPDCVIVGTTTGGIDRTEMGLLAGCVDAEHYALHGGGTVATEIADAVGCGGAAFSVSTACSSGAVAIAVALGLLRAGAVGTALAGGADALCHLTLHGFRLLQLLDPEGARPLDQTREGTSLGEGAAFLWLEAGDRAPDRARAEVVGAGLSCDAFHATKPRPDGDRAAEAMRRALRDAGIEASRVGYVNLHGTGTPDNDAAEAAAVRAVFPAGVPLSSTKGATGHALAAAGALEAVLSIGALNRGLLLPNVGLTSLDPALQLEPVRVTQPARLEYVLSSSFGFGGNNAALVFGQPGSAAPPAAPVASEFALLEVACASPVGGTDDSIAAVADGTLTAGSIPERIVFGRLAPRVKRRLKRLSALVLSLAEELRETVGATPRAVALATAWGSLQDTHAFLAELFASENRLASPTAFIGSVHNAAAGQAALGMEATGANLTVLAGRNSLEAGLLAARAVTREEDLPLLFVAADEHHPELSPLLDPGCEAQETAVALLLGRTIPGQVAVRPLLPCRRDTQGAWAVRLAEQLTGSDPAVLLVRGGFGIDSLAAAFPGARVVVRRDPGNVWLDVAVVGRAYRQGTLPAPLDERFGRLDPDRSTVLVTVDRWVSALEVRRG